MARTIQPPNIFPQPPMQQKMIGEDGIMNQSWLMWFSLVFSQIQAAAYVPSSVDITGGTIGGDTSINTSSPITAPQFNGSLHGNADTATTAGSSSSAATATNALACSGNAATATALAPGAGLTVVIVTAALTLAGTQGSMTFTNGVLTAQVAAT